MNATINSTLNPRATPSAPAIFSRRSKASYAAMCLAFVAGALGSVQSAIAVQAVSIDLTGVQIRNATNQTRTSSPNLIDPAFQYSYTIRNANVRGVGGVLGLLYPNPVSLESVISGLGGGVFGTSALINNPTGTIPTTLIDQTLAGSTVQLGVTFAFSANLVTSINAQGVASFVVSSASITSSSPFLAPGYLQFTSGFVDIATSCIADFDQDGGVTGADVGAFFNDFQQGFDSADVDGSGGIDGSDIGFFFTRFEQGC